MEGRTISPAPKAQKVITLSQQEILAFCGDQDRKLRKIQGKLKARIIPRGNEIRLSGSAEDVESAYRVITDLLEIQRSTHVALTEKQIHHALDEGEETPPGHIQGLLGNALAIPGKRQRLTPLTAMQRHYIQAMREKDILFCIGPAGTGKTYLAMAMAVSLLLEGKVSRIILVRPVVEAGEHLGFLPGDIQQKFDPYVRPLYDALYEMIEAEKIREFMDNGVIEIAPLAYMRGRTLNNSFVIVDEAQNTSVEQMKMVLTRLGFESKMVITGDVTQIDLPRSRISGLASVQKILADIPEIEFVHFTRKDIVRHELVQKIIQAYEAHGKKHE